MMAEEWIDGEWIRERLHSSGKSQREFARVLGIDPSGVSRLLDGKRKLKADEMRTVRAFFANPDAVEGAAGAGIRPVRGGGEDEPRVRRSVPGPRPRSRLSADIPIYGSILRDRPPFFDLSGGPPAEYRACPAQLIGVAGAFGLFVPDDGLAPRMRAGEVIYVHPHKPPVAGTDVVVRLRSPAGRIAVLRCRGGDERVVRFGPVTTSRPPERHEKTLDLERGEILQIGRIVLIAME